MSNTSQRMRRARKACARRKTKRVKEDMARQWLELAKRTYDAERWPPGPRLQVDTATDLDGVGQRLGGIRPRVQTNGLVGREELANALRESRFSE